MKQSPKTTGRITNKITTSDINLSGCLSRGNCPVVWQKNEVCTCAAGMVKKRNTRGALAIKNLSKALFLTLLFICTKVHKFAQFFRVTFCPSSPVLALPEGDFVRAQKTVSFSRAGDGGTARVSGGKLHLSLKTAGMPDRVSFIASQSRSYCKRELIQGM